MHLLGEVLSTFENHLLILPFLCAQLVRLSCAGVHLAGDNFAG